MNEKIVALFDMDGTLCNYHGALNYELEKMRGNEEPVYDSILKDKLPEHIRQRIRLITSNYKWWAELPKLKLGWDIKEVVEKMGFKIMILTQGPRRNPSAWQGKKMWIDANLGEDVDITITRDKSLVYGRILVDDYPKYVEEWLKHRPRGLAIMPANKMNENFRHKQVIRYDGSNLKEVAEAIKKARNVGQYNNI